MTKGGLKNHSRHSESYWCTYSFALRFCLLPLVQEISPTFNMPKPTTPLFPALMTNFPDLKSRCNSFLRDLRYPFTPCQPFSSAGLIYGSIKPARPPAYSRLYFERHDIDGKSHRQHKHVSRGAPSLRKVGKASGRPCNCAIDIKMFTSRRYGS